MLLLRRGRLLLRLRLHLLLLLLNLLLRVEDGRQLQQFLPGRV
jgi:hypothetical protein